MSFTTDTPVPPSALPPPARDRITATLDARGMRYGIDDDGDVGGYWDGHLFYFFLLGEDDGYLQVRGRWNREIGVDQLPAVLAAVNEWNVSHLWPKGCVAVEDDLLGVYAEHTVDYTHGVSDAQLDLHLGCGISSALQLFADLDERYPAAAAAARAEHERAQQQGGR